MDVRKAALTRFLLLAAAISCIDCGRREVAPPPEYRSEAPGASTVVEATPPADAPQEEPPESPQKEIVIDTVTVANPLIVKGRARTFENAVSVRVLDSAGKLVVEDHGTSVGEMGQHNPFTVEVWLPRDPGAEVTVEAFEYSAKDGSVQSLARRKVAYDIKPVDVALTFPVGDCTNLRSFQRHIPKSTAMARLLVEALLAGPTSQEKASGATSVFPQGSDVRSVILRNGELTVDLNERLQNVGGSCAALAIRDSLTRTLRQLPTVRSVVITANGERDLALQP